jgi:formylglycine-generating enzyme required for sulfatase activity
MIDVARSGLSVENALGALRLDANGYPSCTDSRAIMAAIAELRGAAGAEGAREILAAGFLEHAGERYREHVEPLMIEIAPASFEMGTDTTRQRHFCGEVPRHHVTLSAYAMAQVPVTNALYALLDPKRGATPRAERSHPAVDLSWYDASVFALWVGCRMPTEAEWEFCCGAGSGREWCCEEADLVRHAWYSENAGGRMQPVGGLAPNALGLYDMHGGAWEWCADDYDASFYVRSPVHDPLCVAQVDLGERPHKVCRGGSVHSLAEMCRTRYRLHEPPDYWAADLGFRLAHGGAHS